MTAKKISDSLLDWLYNQIEFSLRTFGAGKRTVGIIEHIRKELKEVKKSPTELMEWIDIVILGLDGAWRAGYTPEDIVQALFNKQKINIKRDWPDPISEDEPIEHLKGG